MVEIYTDKDGKVFTLTTQDVVELHRVLTDNYQLLPEMEPVSPPGVKNMIMLESAVSRQTVGSGDYYKYPTWSSNCATLVFGLVKNHAFHNGNKRIGFLAMIKHLYTNGYVIKPGVKHEEIYILLRELANNNLAGHAREFHPRFLKMFSSSWTDEVDVQYFSYWLKVNTEHKNKKIKFKTISVNQLLGILNCKKFEASYKKKYLTVAEKQSLIQDIFGFKPKVRMYMIKDAGYVPLNIVESIRKDFKLSQLDGVDNNSFYNDEHILNNEILSYKRIIYKLAKT